MDKIKIVIEENKRPLHAYTDIYLNNKKLTNVQSYKLIQSVNEPAKLILTLIEPEIILETIKLKPNQRGYWRNYFEN